MLIDHQAAGGQSILRRDVPLSASQMRAVAPSLFLPPAPAIRFETPTGATVELIDHLQKAGFDVFEVGQSRKAGGGDCDQARHFVRLRHRTQCGLDDPNEVVLLGGTARHSTYSLFAGVCRTVCQNDLVSVTPIRQVVRTRGEEGARAVAAAAQLVMDDFPTVDAHKQAMKALWMDRCDQRAFARAALDLLHDAHGGGHAIKPSQLLEIARPEDDASDLWTTLNRVHEHLIRGGVLLRQPDGRRARTRGIPSIDDSVTLSRALWRLAEAMCELKAG